MSLLVDNPTVGSDVEFFLRDKKSGDIITAEGLIQGTKWEPHKFVPGNDYYAMQLDNVLAEGNIPPARSSSEFYEYLAFLRDSIEKTVGKGIETVAMPSARLKDVYLQSDTAKTFGCDPSLNCWSLEPQGVEATGDNLRSAGFHIHVGYTDLSVETNIALARAMDLFLGVPSILIEPENERRKVGYGAAGNFRHQPHGVEYRALSSFFASEKKYIDWVYNNTQQAIDFVNKYTDHDYLKGWGQQIQDTINGMDFSQAKSLIKEFGVKVLK